MTHRESPAKLSPEGSFIDSHWRLLSFFFMVIAR